MKSIISRYTATQNIHNFQNSSRIITRRRDEANNQLIPNLSKTMSCVQLMTSLTSTSWPPCTMATM
ncbi:hypothetical protein BGZ61DRAFT_439248 [Ilyonectria robusta]|uniref:uncharacterized protein n=1 Tax=Ilyonectria robusta TaxID=1079257 RepID=UPI001E8E675D|nr:uncharacterized protein BGZ61DRAFT_439248 [Ilyonectria robusta]KAH8737926.1 hypothetical protein BGZ61DRAFT_439248 [Ilyonectria robusta]